MAGYILFMSTATKENEEEFKSVDVWTVNPLIRLTERELRAAAASTAAEFLQSLCVAARPRPHTHHHHHHRKKTVSSGSCTALRLRCISIERGCAFCFAVSDGRRRMKATKRSQHQRSFRFIWTIERRFLQLFVRLVSFVSFGRVYVFIILTATTGNLSRSAPWRPDRTLRKVALIWRGRQTGKSCLFPLPRPNQ